MKKLCLYVFICTVGLAGQGDRLSALAQERAVKTGGLQKRWAEHLQKLGEPMVLRANIQLDKPALFVGTISTHLNQNIADYTTDKTKAVIKANYEQTLEEMQQQLEDLKAEKKVLVTELRKLVADKVPDSEQANEIERLQRLQKENDDAYTLQKQNIFDFQRQLTSNIEDSYNNKLETYHEVMANVFGIEDWKTFFIHQSLPFHLPFVFSFKKGDGDGDEVLDLDVSTSLITKYLHLRQSEKSQEKVESDDLKAFEDDLVKRNHANVEMSDMEDLFSMKKQDQVFDFTFSHLTEKGSSQLLLPLHDVDQDVTEMVSRIVSVDFVNDEGEAISYPEWKTDGRKGMIVAKQHLATLLDINPKQNPKARVKFDFSGALVIPPFIQLTRPGSISPMSVLYIDKSAVGLEKTKVIAHVNLPSVDQILNVRTDVLFPERLQCGLALFAEDITSLDQEEFFENRFVLVSDIFDLETGEVSVQKSTDIDLVEAGRYDALLLCMAMTSKPGGIYTADDDVIPVFTTHVVLGDQIMKVTVR
ncbi:MAG: hypothetical protein R3A45_01065 [Bdellovibrionota bacterium]